MIVPGWLVPWLHALAVFSVIVVAGFLLQAGIVHVMNRHAERWHPFLRHVFQRTRRLGRFAMLLLAIAVALPLMPLSRDYDADARRAFTALFIILLGWMVDVAANLAIDRYEKGFNLDSADNLLARKAITQMRIFRQALESLPTTLFIADWRRAYWKNFALSPRAWDQVVYPTSYSNASLRRADIRN